MLLGEVPKKNAIFAENNSIMKKIVVLTGAGISAESGISTFRDTNGLWENYNVMDVATHDAWYKDKALVTQFYNERRAQLKRVAPNSAHIGLKEWEQWFNVVVITQNVDNLHERAGSSHIIHLHGELTKVCSENNTDLVYELPEDKYEVHIGDLAEDGAQLRPFVVFFQEPVPMMEAAIKECDDADILVIIGTSMAVYPAAGLIHYVPRNIPKFLIDPKEVKVTNNTIQVIQKTASQGVKELTQILKEKYL